METTRQRIRASEQATRQLSELRKQRAAVQTYDAMKQFEDRLSAAQEAMDGMEDLPEEAGAMPGHRKTAGLSRAETLRDSSAAHTSDGSTLQRSSSAPHISRHMGPDDETLTRRPPSPLSFYDYGSVSMKPRSLFAQHRRRQGEDVRPKHRQTSCGFYFPGAHYKQGSYGFSLIDPCLMPPRSWASSSSPPVRWSGGPSEVRPLSSEEIGLKRNRQAGPVVSPIVRSNSAHTRRAQRLFHCLDKRQDEAILEQARFENALVEGRWRDPLLDSKGEPLEMPAPETFEWLDHSYENMQPAHQAAAAVLSSLDEIVTTTRWRIADLFAGENKGHPGVLEPDEFFRGLTRLGVVSDGFTLDDLMRFMSTIDPCFDGLVRLPVVSRAVGVARSKRMRAEEAKRLALKQRQVKLRTSYSETIPCEVVRIEPEPSSLLNFNRACAKFKGQQTQLLSHHNELGPSVSAE